eukprot:6162069-Amphidinium_carterae.7
MSEHTRKPQKAIALANKHRETTFKGNRQHYQVDHATKPPIHERIQELRFKAVEDPCTSTQQATIQATPVRPQLLIDKRTPCSQGCTHVPRRGKVKQPQDALKQAFSFKVRIIGNAKFPRHPMTIGSNGGVGEIVPLTSSSGRVISPPGAMSDEDEGKPTVIGSKLLTGAILLVGLDTSTVSIWPPLSDRTLLLGPDP